MPCSNPFRAKNARISSLFRTIVRMPSGTTFLAERRLSHLYAPATAYARLGRSCRSRGQGAAQLPPRSVTVGRVRSLTRATVPSASTFRGEFPRATYFPKIVQRLACAARKSNDHNILETYSRGCIMPKPHVRGDKLTIAIPAEIRDEIAANDGDEIDIL